MTQVRTSQSVESSYAFLIKLFFRLEKVVFRDFSLLINFMLNFPLPMFLLAQKKNIYIIKSETLKSKQKKKKEKFNSNRVNQLTVGVEEDHVQNGEVT